MKQEYWEKRYYDSNTPWDLDQVSPPLKAYFNQLTDKNIRVLIPGCGSAHEAMYLSDLKFESITVVDFVDKALDSIRKSNERINAICSDFFQFNMEADLIIEQTMFCAIDPKRREDYVKHCSELLSGKGKFVGVLFASKFEKEGPPHGGTQEEYQHIFEKHFSRVKIELCYNSIKPRRGNELFIIAEK